MQRQVRMLRREKGQDTDEKGCALPVKTYFPGEVYQLGAPLASTFLSMGVAEIFPPVVKEAAPENKQAPPPVQNKTESAPVTRIDSRKKQGRR